MVKVIEDYTLLESVGNGSYGEVFKASHTMKQGYFAIKVISNRLLQSNPKIEQCLINEVKVLSKMGNCENIVQFHELIKSKNNHYFVYQYCNGGTLQQRIKEKEQMSEADVMDLLKQIINAFKILNKFKVMHRDLKPENILFHNDVLKLGDFGLCKGLTPEEDMAKTMLGTPIYMAPEILKNQPYSTKGDIWSLGVILYQMLYGYCPFQSGSIVGLVNKIDNNSVEFPEHPQVSERTKNLLKRMLTKDYFRRISWIQLFKEVPTQQSAYSKQNLSKTSKSNINIPFRPSLYQSSSNFHLPLSTTHNRIEKENKSRFSSAKYMEYISTNFQKKPEKWIENLIMLHNKFEELSRTISLSMEEKNMKVLEFIPDVLRMVRDKLLSIYYQIESEKGERVKELIEKELSEIDLNIGIIKDFLVESGHHCRPLKEMNYCVLPIQFEISLRQFKSIK